MIAVGYKSHFWFPHLLGVFTRERALLAMVFLYNASSTVEYWELRSQRKPQGHKEYAARRGRTYKTTKRSYITAVATTASPRFKAHAPPPHRDISRWLEVLYSKKTKPGPNEETYR